MVRGLQSICLGILLGVLLSHLRDGTSTIVRLRREVNPNSTSVTTPHNITDDDKNHSSPHGAEPLHVLYGGLGNHSGFIKELTTSLKSVLLNAPIDVPLEIHFLLDSYAQLSIRAALKNLTSINENSHTPHRGEIRDISEWKMRQPVHIHTYNIDVHKSRWTKRVLDTFRNYPPTINRFRHSLGSYFRLFAHDVLPKKIKHVLYMDSDVLVMAGLDVVWQSILEQDRKQLLFQWGAEHCAGFSTINVGQLPLLWQIVHDAPEIRNPPRKLKAKLKLGDQYILRLVDRISERVGRLPPEWDVSAGNGEWARRSVNGRFMESHHRPNGVGMLHYNGGGSNLETAFKNHKFVNINRSDLFPSWGLSSYYVNLPWNWAKFLVQSRIEHNNSGYPVKLWHHL